MLHDRNLDFCGRSVGRIRTVIALLQAREPAVCEAAVTPGSFWILWRRGTSFADARNCIKFVVSYACRCRSPSIAIKEFAVMVSGPRTLVNTRMLSLAAVTANCNDNTIKYKSASYNLNPPRHEGVWRSRGRAAGIPSLGV
jgi:hypothetical protein